MAFTGGRHLPPIPGPTTGPRRGVRGRGGGGWPCPGGRRCRRIPGATNVPDRGLRAMDFPTIDHRGPEFAALGTEVLEAVKAPFGTTNPVVIYPGSGTGAWEAARGHTPPPGGRGGR